MPTLQEKWDQAQSLFLAAADLCADDCIRFLEVACAGDGALRSEVESLIEADRTSTRHIFAAVEDEASRLVDSQFPGDRLGAYRIKGKLGRGGMGAVFLATRDDDQYQREVAIKVCQAWHGHRRGARTVLL